MADATANQVGSSVEQPRLAAGAIGLAGQLFQSITHMAPAAGVIFSAQYMASKGGGSLTLAWLLATIACLLTALCLKEVVRKVRSAGGYFVIHSVALGHCVGFTTSRLLIWNDWVFRRDGQGGYRDRTNQGEGRDARTGQEASQYVGVHRS